MTKAFNGFVTFSLRMVLGSLLLFAGFGKILMGTERWSANLITLFAGSPWISAQLIAFLGWVVLILELFLGVLLIMGWKTQAAFGLTILLFALLNVGLMILDNGASVSTNMSYIIVATLGAWLAGKGNMWSVD